MLMSETLINDFCGHVIYFSKWTPKKIEEARKKSFEDLKLKEPRAIKFVNDFWDACLSGSMATHAESGVVPCQIE